MVPNENSKLKVDDLKSWCKKHAPLAPYTIPTVRKVVDSKPRNAMGKVVRSSYHRRSYLLLIDLIVVRRLYVSMNVVSLLTNELRNVGF